MNSWIYASLTVGLPLLFYIYFKKRMGTSKAGLTAVTMYILIGLIMIARGWNISPWTIILPGLFVAFLDVLQLRHHS